jgi:hypothetical protein
VHHGGPTTYPEQTMSYFSDASLVLVPSAQKSGKVYSIKPTDGTGDLTFTRSNDTATRVGPDGLIEKVRTNLATYSQDFSNADWGKVLSTVSTNTTANPLNGEVDADTITCTGINPSYVYGSENLLGGYTISCYVKAGTNNFFALNIQGTATHWCTAVFNLSTGALGQYAVGVGGNTTYVSHNITSVGSGWYRCSLTINSSNISTANYHSLMFAPAATGNTFSAQYGEPSGNTNGNTLILFGAQLEVSDFGATDYIATTTAAVSVGPVANVPRLDYLNSSCPRLLLEPQRTNIATYSEQFDNVAGWTLYNGTQVANTTETLDPSGYYGAEKAIMGGTNSATYRKSIGGLTNGDTYTFSLYIKQGSGVTAFLDICDASTTPDITPTSEWVRYTKTGVWDTSLNFVDIELRGTSGSFCYIWGAQLELGAYATSYIPTLGAAVTRGAESAVKTGISSLIGQTEGTLFAEFTRLNVGNAVVLFQCNDGTNNNRAQLEIGTSGIATGVVISGAAVSCVITGATLALGQTHKIALTYKANDFKFYVNGVLAGTDTSGAVPVSMSRIELASELGTSYAGVSVSQILNFPTALSSAQLAELTA